ncbi:hypothetical protein [Streptacidiphilus jiangxiensis]|uniref:hypothetical protein n=1 Tax=Streptacidiphilus jiangxiensis TaxID=235985 RepID=UPI000693C767|nr:hypothetical protein [Streptacidiphilus jiangxiensis]
MPGSGRAGARGMMAAMDASTTTPTAAAMLPVTAPVPFGTKDALKQLKPLFAAEQRRARVFSRTKEWNAEGLPRREATAGSPRTRTARSCARMGSCWTVSTR